MRCFFPTPKVFTRFLIMKQPVIPQEWVGGGRWGQLYLVIYLFILAFNPVWKQESGIYSVWKRGKTKVSSFAAKLLRVKSPGKMWAVSLLVKRDPLSCVQVTFFTDTEKRCCPYTQQDQTCLIPEAGFVGKIKNTKPFIKNYFHFQLLSDLCV